MNNKIFQFILGDNELIKKISNGIGVKETEFIQFASKYIKQDGSKDIIIFTDGGSRNNPGESGCGFYVKNDLSLEYNSYYFYLGVQTNNFAEYTGLINAMNFASDNGYKNLIIYTDSQLVVNQVNGSYKVKSDNLIFLHSKVKMLKKKFNSCKIEHILRAKNKIADELANIAMDKKQNGKRKF